MARHKCILTALADQYAKINQSKNSGKKLTSLSNITSFVTSSDSSKSSHNQTRRSIDLNEEKNLTRLINSTILTFIETENLLLQDVRKTFENQDKCENRYSDHSHSRSIIFCESRLFFLFNETEDI